MKANCRKEKLSVLQAAFTGKIATIRQYHRQQQSETFFMVVCDNGTPKPTDLVDTRLPDEQGRGWVLYADFLKNPITYGSFCITVDS
ncbi:hypothetical protein [Spirosoma jeollabukense]